MKKLFATFLPMLTLLFSALVADEAASIDSEENSAVGEGETEDDIGKRDDGVERIGGYAEGETFLFSGTLLDLIANNTPPGKWYIAPYLTVVNNYANYNSGGHPVKVSDLLIVNQILQLETGITQWLSVTVAFQEFYRKSQGVDAFSVGPIQSSLNLQLLSDVKGNPLPSLRLSVGEIFPIGHYDKLNPKKLALNASGNGAFGTAAICVMKKVFYTHPFPLALELSTSYTWNMPVSIKGYSFYGGSNKTHGTARPGNLLFLNLGAELSLTRAWVLASDFNYQYQSATHFSGNTGVPGLSLNQPKNQQFSITPSVEYNWNSNFGIIFGSWLTLAGQNTYAFAGGFIELSWII